MHYAQPLLREAGFLADAMAQEMPLQQRRWLGLQMLERRYLQPGLRRRGGAKPGYLPCPSEGRNGRPGAAYRRRRYQCIAAICDVVSNTLTAEPSRFTRAVDKIILNRFLGLPIFLFVMYLMSCSPLTSAARCNPV
ncbi:ferrous iron transport protein B [Salmonella enterica subsp. enterica]|uniref:Ferrous iron transport protein B n=1 Tax=Salmonella enterica I TaxID=59201 RepID=A0A379WKL3_SALET|nr:ferrous iron transport protein B [Salmonella enterica subsp. enterica]